MNSGQDICGICEQPFPKNMLRFTHFIEHVNRGDTLHSRYALVSAGHRCHGQDREEGPVVV